MCTRIMEEDLVDHKEGNPSNEGQCAKWGFEVYSDAFSQMRLDAAPISLLLGPRFLGGALDKTNRIMANYGYPRLNHGNPRRHLFAKFTYRA